MDILIIHMHDNHMHILSVAYRCTHVHILYNNTETWQQKFVSLSDNVMQFCSCVYGFMRTSNCNKKQSGLSTWTNITLYTITTFPAFCLVTANTNRIMCFPHACGNSVRLPKSAMHVHSFCSLSVRFTAKGSSS